MSESTGCSRQRRLELESCQSTMLVFKLSNRIQRRKRLSLLLGMSTHSFFHGRQRVLPTAPARSVPPPTRKEESRAHSSLIDSSTRGRGYFLPLSSAFFRFLPLSSAFFRWYCPEDKAKLILPQLIAKASFSSCLRRYQTVPGKEVADSPEWHLAASAIDSPAAKLDFPLAFHARSFLPPPPSHIRMEWKTSSPLRSSVCDLVCCCVRHRSSFALRRLL